MSISKFILNLAALLVLQGALTAQPLLQAIGYGNFRENGSAIEAGLGYATTAHYDSVNFLPNNPASWHDLRTVKILTGGTVGLHLLSGDALYQPTGSSIASQYQRMTRLQLGFPIGQRIYASVGTEPVTDMAGQFKDVTDTSFTAPVLTVTNSGGVWSMFVGAGVKINEKISLGLKWHRLTGYYAEEAVQYYPDLSTNSSSKLSGNIRGNLLELGVQAHLFSNMLYGVTVNLPVIEPSFKGEVTLTGSPNTVSYSESMPDWPARLAMGVEYKYSERVYFLIDLSQRFFSEEAFQNSHLFKIPESWDDNVNSSSSFNSGLLIRHSDLVGTFFERTDWRMGFYHKIFYASPSPNTYIRETYLTGGLGVPLPQNRSRLDFSLGVGKRGGLSGYPEENLVNFKISIQTSELWFTNAKRR
ncbi:MAG: hypothetical protein K9N34_00335 [Candidatus Marinimicrobia bacterium]|nr:hypothetical protein [Candidatus Neomarinimicrobiota bacterium]MCF7839207.1 hypothetical protein [Candidatus Neomarinimicrobiota bacterium]MCF7903016.1 hypothetical protein [Candidatus Neomarinimicrobiota bacterium]